MNTTQSETISVWPVERKDGTYAVRICLEQGELPLPLLERLMAMIKEYGLSLRITTAQRLNLAGISKEQLDAVVAALGAEVKKCPPGVTVCTGAGVCKLGVQETRSISRKLVALIQENGPYPFKIKSGVSGCGMSCGLSYVRDIGLVAKAHGWDLYFGGSATSSPGPGVLLGTELSEEQVLGLVANGLAYYKENGKKRERIGGMVRRIGSEAIVRALS